MNNDDRDNENDIKGALLASIGEIEEKTPGSTGDLADLAPKSQKQDTPSGETTDPAAKAGTAPAKPAGEQSDRVRDPATGKFVPADTAKAVDATKSAQSAKTDADPAKAGDVAPGSLPADIKAEWANYSPATKAFLVKQEQERGQAAGRAGHELRQLKAQYEPLEQLLSPRRAAVVAQHGSMEAWLDQVLKYSDFAGADPEGFLAWYLSQPNIGSRVDLNKLFGQSGDGAQRSPALATDPTVKALQQELTGLKGRLQQFEGQSQTQQQNSITSELDAFEQEKDTSGQPKYPHYVTLRDSGVLLPEMHIVRQSNPQMSFRQILAQAYDNCVWKHSDTRNAVLAQREKQAQDEKEARERADAASRARKFVTGQPPAKVQPDGVPKDSLRDEIAANYAAALGGPSRL